jgi:hypothetical protein
MLVHIKAILNKVKGSYGSLGITRKLQLNFNWGRLESDPSHCFDEY